MYRASEPDLIDGSVLLALREFRVPDEPDPAQEVLAAFLEVTPTRLERLHQAVQGGDVDEVRALAHQVRGSSGTVGAVGMHAAAAELEACTSASDAEALVGALEALFARTRPLLESVARAEDPA
jgi:HPt (histidine-containing phosphotransfer) domain-containing protein